LDSINFLMTLGWGALRVESDEEEDEDEEDDDDELEDESVLSSYFLPEW